MTLIYRGETVEVPSYAEPIYCKPRALNWRYQIPGEPYGEPDKATFVNPAPRTSQVINWRWQPM